MTARDERTVRIDPTRHRALFDPEIFHLLGLHVHVVGLNPVGSEVAYLASKLGIEGIHLWDPGTLDRETLPRGSFAVHLLQQPLVDAMKRQIDRWSHGNAIPHRTRLTAESEAPHGIIFLTAGTHGERRELVRDLLGYSITAKLVVDVEYNSVEGYVRSFDPNVPAEVERWMAAPPGIGSSRDVLVTGSVVLGALALWQMMVWFRAQSNREIVRPFEIRVPLEKFGHVLSVGDTSGAHRFRRVDFIGAGATGSHAIKVFHQLQYAGIWQLLGVEEIHVWDFDSIEPHNIANQAFTLADVGRPKVHAIGDLVTSLGVTQPVMHYEKVTEATSEIGDLVFLLVDSMSARRLIAEHVLIPRKVDLVIETRLGARSAEILSFSAARDDESSQWLSTLVRDEDVIPDNACGTTVTAGPAAYLVAAMAVGEVLRVARAEERRFRRLAIDLDRGKMR